MDARLPDPNEWPSTLYLLVDEKGKTTRYVKRFDEQGNAYWEKLPG
jgi:hypothetical protein